MKLFDEGGKITEIIQDGYSEWIIDTNDYLELVLVCDGQSDLFVKVKHAESITFHMQVLENASCTLFVWNESDCDITFNEKYEVRKNSVLKIAYGECNKANSTRKSTVLLKDEGAVATIKSATLCQSNKKFIIECVSEAPHTEGNIENYSVVVDHGNYQMEATGCIKKGAHGSKSHQTSRALTFDENQTATILPKLLIDENDVEASHATSVGQIDENQLVYLQSRGLTERQVMSLITIGYLTPIANFIENEELQKMLREEIESKVGETCLI